MTETVHDEAQIMQLPGGDTERDTTNDAPLFRLGDNDTVLTGKRPKLAVLLRLMTIMNDDTDPVAQAGALDQFIEKVLQPESAGHLRDRLEDEDDDLDLDSPGIVMMFQTLVGLWYQGPTGGGAASRRSPSPTSKRSTGRRPSKGRTR